MRFFLLFILIVGGCAQPPSYYSPDPRFSPEDFAQVLGAIEVWRAACPDTVPPIDLEGEPNILLDCAHVHAFHPEAIATTNRAVIFVCPDSPVRMPARRSDLVFVAVLHELGHVFGLDHSDAKDSVMQAGDDMSTWDLPVVPSEADTAFCR